MTDAQIPAIRRSADRLILTLALLHHAGAALVFVLFFLR